MKNYKKIKLYTILTFIICSIYLTACSNTDNQDASSFVQQVKSSVDSEESRNIEIIKNMILDNGYKLGDLVENSMGSPTYEFYDPAEDGNTYITINGKVSYMDKPIVATIQYKKIDDTNYELYTIEFNEIPQNQIMQTAFLKFLIDSYEKDNSIKSDNIKNNTNVENNYSFDNEYILPTADIEYISFQELDELYYQGGKKIIRRAVNEMFARHGATFNKQENIDYFSQKSWYFPIEDISDEYIKEHLFNEYEKQNLETLLYFEDLHKND